MGMVHYDFLSEKLGYHTNIYFILPECMKEGKEPEATLYLLHGGGGNGLDWIRFTAIERYAEVHNIAVVMPEVAGYCFYSDMKYGYPYFQYLTEEVPMIAETLFSVNCDSKKRFVAGLSMGGYGAFKWAFNYPDFFAAAANLSGISFIMELFHSDDGFARKEARAKNGAVELNWGSLEELSGSNSDSKVWIDNASMNKEKLPALFAAIGTEDFSYAYAQRYLDYSKSKGIDIHYEEMTGEHEWKVWDVMIERFVIWAKEQIVSK